MVAARGTASTRIDPTIVPARASRVESPSAIVRIRDTFVREDSTLDASRERRASNEK